MAQAYPCCSKEDNIMNGTISKMGQSQTGTISWDNHPTMGLPQQWGPSTIMTSPQMGQHVHQPIMSTAMAITHTTVRQGWDHSSRSNDREKQKSGTFLPPPQRRRFIPIINHEKIIKKKCPSSNPTSEHRFPRKYYPLFHRSRPGKTLTDDKNIFSKNHVQIQQGNKHKKLSPSGQKCVCSKESTCIFDRSWDKKGFASHVVRVRRKPNPNLIAEILMTHTTRLVLAKMKTTKQTSVLDFHWPCRILVWFHSGILMSSGGSQVGP